MRSGETWYEILDISSDASAEEIRLAYFEHARQYHPDSNPNERAKELFYQVQEAYEILSDPQKRIDYDDSIRGRSKKKSRLEFSVIYGKDTILRINETQIVYAMLELNCAVENEKAQIPNGYMCFVIDCSTSMNGSRIEMIKDNIIRLLSHLKPTDLISIITFNDKAELLLTPTRVDEANQIKERLNSIKCSGGTEIYKGLKAGCDLYWGSSSIGYYKQILLFTDGHTYGDEENCFELAQKLQTRGIRLSTLGIGNEWNDVFLDHLAGITGGNSTYISNAGDLQEFVQKLSDSVSILASNGVTLEYKSDPLVTTNSFYRLLPDISELPLDQPIPLGEIYHNRKSIYLVTFTIAPIQDEKTNILLAKGKIRYEMISPINEKFTQFVNLSLQVTNKSTNENPPKAIMDALNGITIFQMQEKANNDVKNGNIEQAIERLGHITTQLQKLGNNHLAKRVNNEIEMLKRNKRYSTYGDKQLKYGTRALIAPDGFEKRKP